VLFSMTVVPIVFAFDKNLLMPAGVCLYSLLSSAMSDTFYDVFILYPKTDPIDFQYLEILNKDFDNFKISYRPVEPIFSNAYQIRGITTPAYYRLLIPNLIPEYSRVIYSDVDVVFRTDLSELYSISLEDNYFAATLDLGMNLSSDGKHHMKEIGIPDGRYVQSGFLIVNSDQIRKDSMIEKFIEHGKESYKFQDQDIINITCGSRIKILPMKYNMTDYSYSYVNGAAETVKSLVGDKHLYEENDSCVLHYNGHKPWKGYSINFDIWWEYYRNSPFYSSSEYYVFFASRLNMLDTLSLWKRIKVLARYFVYGRK